MILAITANAFNAQARVGAKKKEKTKDNNGKASARKKVEPRFVFSFLLTKLRLLYVMLIIFSQSGRVSPSSYK